MYAKRSGMYSSIRVGKVHDAPTVVGESLIIE